MSEIQTGKIEEGVYLLRAPNGKDIAVQYTRGGFYPLTRQNLFSPSIAGGINKHPALCSCTGTTAETATPLVAGETGAVCPEYLWYVQNNGMDGDNWTLNNVRTGGVGAIGWRVPATSPLAEELRRLAAEIAALPEVK